MILNVQGLHMKKSKWANTPTLLDLKYDFNQSKTEHDSRVGRAKSQTDALNATGSHSVTKRKGKSNVKPKLIKRNAEWRYTELSEPFLEDDEKLFSAAATSWEDKDNAVQNETLLNWQFNHQIDKQVFIDTSTRKFVDEGVVFARVGWCQETRKVIKDVPLWQYVLSNDPNEMALQQEILIRALELREGNPYLYNQLRDDIIAAVEYYDIYGQVVIAQLAQTIKEEVEELVYEAPTVSVINQANLYLDPTCDGLIDDAKFAIYLFLESKADLVASGLYENLDKVNWEDSGLTTDTNFTRAGASDTSSTTFRFNDEARKQAIVYEYWGFYDIDGDGLLEPIVAAWIGDTLIRLEENPYPDKKLPFCSAKYRPIVGEYDGESDAPLIEDNQHTVGAITRGIVDLLAKAANGQRGVANGLLDETNFGRFSNGQDYMFNPNGDPNSQIVTSKFSEVPISALNVIQWQQMDAESLTGVKSFGTTGLSGEAYGQVAAGVSPVTNSAAQRKMGILRRYKKFIVDIGEKILAMNQVFLSEDKVVRVTNDEYVPVAKDRLKGNFDITLNISSREIDQQKASRIAFILQTMGNTLPFDVTKRVMAEYARLERLPELAHSLMNMEPPAPSQADALVVAKLQSEVMENESRAILNQAKAVAEGSKTKISDLNYLEQGTGVAHQRELQRQRAQAQANQNLEITKGILKRNMFENPESASNINDAVGYNILSQQIQNLTE